MDYSYSIYHGHTCLKDRTCLDEYINIYFVLSGQASTTRTHQTRTYHTGDMFVQTPKCEPLMIEIKVGNIACLTIHQVYLDQVYLKHVPHVKSNFEVYHDIKRAYIEALRLVCDEQVIKANKVMFRLVSYLRVYLENFDHHLFNVTKHHVINHIIEYVNHNYDEALKLSCIAQRFNINISYLSRKFRDELNMTYKVYVNKVKIYNAAEYMALHPVLDSELETMWQKYCFANPRAYLQQFRKLFNVAPREFVAQTKQSRLKGEGFTQEVHDDILKLTE